MRIEQCYRHDIDALFEVLQSTPIQDTTLKIDEGESLAKRIACSAIAKPDKLTYDRKQALQAGNILYDISATSLRYQRLSKTH